MTQVINRSSKILIMGDGHNVVKQFPMFGKGSPLYWWHEKGYIHWEDSRPKGKRPDQFYGMMGWEDFALRVLNLSQMILKSSEDGHYGDERQLMQKFISEAEPLIREAKIFGGLHDDASVREHKRRSATSVVVPQSFPNVVVGGGGAEQLGVGQQKMTDPFKM